MQLSHYFMALSVSLSTVLLLDTTLTKNIAALLMIIQPLLFSPSFWFFHWSSSLVLSELPVSTVNLGGLVVVVMMKRKW